MRLTKPQKTLLALMSQGHVLMWFGDNGPEIDCRESWPQKRTVRELISRGLLKWCEYLNETHRQCGIRQIELTTPEATEPSRA